MLTDAFGPVWCVLEQRLQACTAAAKFNPWHRNVSCGNGGFKCSVDQPIDSPCTDDPALSTGAQQMILDFALLPPRWLGLTGDGDIGHRGAVTECSIFDVFDTPGRGRRLGRFKSRELSAVIPPHGSRFLILSGSTCYTD